MIEATKLLSSGLDTLVLALNVDWKSTALFEKLRENKAKAKEMEKELPVILRGKENDEKWIFIIRPYGVRGYEWLLIGKEFTLRIGNWMESMMRPSVMVEIGSETLWRERS